MKTTNFISAVLCAALCLVSCDKNNTNGNGNETPGGAKPVADFEFTVEDGTGKVSFTNKSQNAVSYEWEFGDEDKGFSSEENPAYTYEKTGDYKVVLTAIAGEAVDVAEKTVKIVLKEEKKTISINLEDNSIDDWKDIPWREDVSSSGLIEGIKTAATDDDLYILLKVKQELISKTGYTHLGFDADYNFETGWNECPFTKDRIAGADFMQEAAGFHLWGWRAEEEIVGWDWIYDGWLQYSDDHEIDGYFYKEWHLDMKRAKAEMSANPVYSEAKDEGIDFAQFATKMSEDKIRGYIWFRDINWEYVASVPEEGGVPFDIQMGEYLKASDK